MTRFENLPAYEIRWSRKAVSYIKRLGPDNRKRIVQAVELLALDLSTQGLDIKPLQGRPGEFRLRVGDYRIIFEPDHAILLISIITVSPRGDVYKK